MGIKIHLRLFILVLLSGVNGGESDYEKEAIKEIAKAAANLPESGFGFDPILFQYPDKVNSVTKYRFPGEAPDQADIYVRNADDSGQETVVLTSEEDHLQFKVKKRAYIVLKKNSKPKSNQSEYFATVAFLRDAGDKDKHPLKISGGSYQIEWDLWDDHFIIGGTTNTLNSIFCSSSVFIPCLFSDTPIESGKNGIVKAAKHYEPKKVDSKDVDGAVKIVVDFGNFDESYDMYRDIDFNEKLMKGRFYGTSSSVTTTTTNDGYPGGGGIVGGVNGILCGVFGGCKRRSTTTTINIDATPTIGVGIGAPIGVVAPVGVVAPAMGYNPYGYTAAGPDYYGGGMGYDMAYGRRKKREADADPSASNALDFPGWKTQFVAPVKGIYFKAENLAFYGFGNCPSKPRTDADLEKAKTGEELVNYYLMVLRSDCTEILKTQLLKLLEMGALQVKGKTLIINDVVKKANNPKFTLHEAIFSQTALEMDAFTTTFIAHKKDKKTEKPMTPDGSEPISRSVNLAVELILNIIIKSRDVGRLHMIAKTRHAITGCRHAFYKLEQDQQNLAGCADCKDGAKLNRADRLTIMGLMQYLKYGLRDVDLHNKDVNKSFKTFFTKNKEFITKKVNMYS